MQADTRYTIGILSDSHRDHPDHTFRQQCATAFSTCQLIFHAGDLTDLSILTVFSGQELHAVHGNSCNKATRTLLPEKKSLLLGGWKIGLSHGTGSRHDIEERMLAVFPGYACIIFGHSHLPLCHRIGDTLLINPGSFRGTGKFGAPGTYAILRIEPTGLTAAIHSLPGPDA